ncbi:hypothetical protein [Olivibacter domesticus]|uniref:Uncharacterized protein n=1 Tax=Olivibacter domesticus TaxID=407022 RepID=A0A1H7PS18_OLID1|nr:hypothetical protein [Olivibacter domesticus]SEL38184.1 hypothetical protein SAMN05661044_02327 [Olivibacter domesticus]
MKTPKKTDKKIGSNNPAKKAGRSGIAPTDSKPKKRFDDEDDDDFDFNDLDNFDNFDDFDDEEDY